MRTKSLVAAAPRLLAVLAVAAAAAPASVLAVLLLRGSTTHFLVAVLPAVALAPIAALLGAGLWLASLRGDEPGRRARTRWIAALLFGVALFCLLLAPSYLVGLAVGSHDVRAAQRYCMTLVPRLEALREQDGEYPVSIQPALPTERPIPRLLEDRVFYQRVGEGFEFTIPDPSGLDAGYQYFSPTSRARGRWDRW